MLDQAIRSIRERDEHAHVVVVVNSEASLSGLPDVDQVITPGCNLGIPGGRAVGVEAADVDVVAFLDDDAQLRSFDPTSVADRFRREPHLGAVSFRLVDELGVTARRHIPRFGRRGDATEGDVATFLGGACAVRVSAYHEAGGYWAALQYGHEELDLAWRLIERGWKVRYAPDLVVFHPRSEISRHERGWWMTGRNRVWIARRNLPFPLLAAHTCAWLLLGVARAPGARAKRSYVRGWWSGWQTRVERAPIRWRTVWQLARLGRPPIL